MVNAERFARIEKHISLEGGAIDYDAFSMVTWERSCGTTRCVAGWAIYDEIGAPLWHRYGMMSERTPEFQALLDRLGFGGIESAAADLLGLDHDLAQVFYTGEGVAFEFVKAAARGADYATLYGILYGEEGELR